MSATICLPIADRQRSFVFYQETLGLVPLGEKAEDGVPEPLQFRLGESTNLMLIPTGGFGWVLGSREPAPAGASECLLSLSLPTSDDVEATCAAMEQLGGELLAVPAQHDWGFVAVATDPDGHAWQLVAEQSVVSGTR